MKLVVFLETTLTEWKQYNCCNKATEVIIFMRYLISNSFDVNTIHSLFSGMINGQSIYEHGTDVIPRAMR